jgi:PAS domain S-box-containing protein
MAVTTDMASTASATGTEGNRLSVEPARTQVLLVEDNPMDARLIEEILTESETIEFHLEWAQTLREAQQQLGTGTFDVVLLDLTLPDSWGLDTFTQIHAQTPLLPVVVLSGVTNEAVALKALQGGAQDYLVKGQADAGVLKRSIRYAIERKRIELALQRERDLFQTLMDHVPDMIYFKDQQSRFVRINRALARRFGLADPQEAVGRTDHDVFANNHAGPALADEQEIMRTGQPLIGKVEKETMPDGRENWVLTTKVPQRDPHGQIIGTFGISKDITELKLIEDQLATERNLLRSLIDALPDHIYVKDTVGRFVVCNAAVARFFGLASADAIAGKTDFDFFPKELAQQFHDEEERLFHNSDPLLNREAAVRDAAGVEHWILTTKVPLRANHGPITGLVGINRDITVRKQALTQLQQLNLDLARSQTELVAAYQHLRTANAELQATQARLIQAAKMESIGRLATGVAHEVKNPLAILLMGVEYLAEELRDKAGPDVAMTVAQMFDAVHRADAIVRGLLDYSSASQLKLVPGNLHHVLEQALLLVRHQLRPKKITVTRQFAPALPSLLLDQPRLEQVFINLFLNSVHAMSAGGHLIITTRTESAANDTQRVIVLIEDNGPGLPAEVLAKIFDPFFTTKPTGQGTGLGLAVSRNIVELHGGTLTLSNRADGGACATLTFTTQPKGEPNGTTPHHDG